MRSVLSCGPCLVVVRRGLYVRSGSNDSLPGRKICTPGYRDRRQMSAQDKDGTSWIDRLSDLLLRAVIATMLLLPYRWRVPAMGWVMRKLVAPIGRYDRRAMENLRKIYPDMAPAKHREITGQVIDNMGRTFIENYSTRDFLARMANAPIHGDGVAAMEQAREAGRAVILVSGHFGNYEAARAALVGRGYNVGGLYRAARNKFFNKHYSRTMLAYGGPVFEQGPRGTTGFVRHLRAGGFLVLLFDQHVIGGERLHFMGKPAATATSAAQLALRYDALLVPFFATRQDNGLDFDICFEAPITPTDAKTMTREMNQRLEERVAKHPAQWFWVHRRWKLREKPRGTRSRTKPEPPR